MYQRKWLIPLAVLANTATGCGDTTTAPDPVSDVAPLVAPEVQYDTVFAGAPVRLTVEVSDDHGLSSIRAEWRDGTPDSEASASGQSVTQDFSHTYEAPGMYAVEFTAFDTSGQSGVAYAVVWVEEPDLFPTVDVVAPVTVVVGERFELGFEASDDRGLDRVIVRFGDGSQAMEFVADQSNCPPTCYRGMVASPGHIYGDVGSFGASVQVLDTAGQSMTVWHTITAIDPP